MPAKVSAEPARFSFARVSWREWTALAAGVLAALALFLPWTNLSAQDQVVEEALRDLPASDVARDAWTGGFLAWCGPLLLLVAGVAVVAFGQFRKVRAAGLPHLWLICAAVALVLMLLAWFAMGRQFDEDTRALLSQGGIVWYAGIGRYLAMLGGVASVAAAVLDVRALRRR
ncbi:hypothetical protein [Amycolatopsis granulosa]|uniref:hypothetical protein n=1 Tax=Amycolatopsis granulosa TaxID=185684 RepID=UPI00141D8289|nr:hypothetical protein [Amycolatopsis granulosa]NIH84970.1 hypothetical protein [Amycolatopsis granulosa]